MLFLLLFFSSISSQVTHVLGFPKPRGMCFPHHLPVGKLLWGSRVLFPRCETTPDRTSGSHWRNFSSCWEAGACLGKDHWEIPCVSSPFWPCIDSMKSHPKQRGGTASCTQHQMVETDSQGRVLHPCPNTDSCIWSACRSLLCYN